MYGELRNGERRLSVDGTSQRTAIRKKKTLRNYYEALRVNSRVNVKVPALPEIHYAVSDLRSLKKKKVTINCK
jgi:hypothetical protein